MEEDLLKRLDLLEKVDVHPLATRLCFFASVVVQTIPASLTAHVFLEKNPNAYV